MVNTEKLQKILNLLELDIDISVYEDYEIKSLLLDIEFTISDFITP